MPNYTVYIPITGYAGVEVVANSEQEAVTKAFEKIEFEDIVTWQAHQKIVDGNIFHGELNEVEIEEDGN